MGIYSVLLSIGAIVGSLLAAALGQGFAVDGLIYSTFAMAIIALCFVRWLRFDLAESKEHSNAETTV
jgi:cyanate permease